MYFLLLLRVGEAFDSAHVRAPRELRARVLVVVAHHLVVASDVAHRVPDRRALEVVLYADSVLRAEVSNQPRRLDQHVIVVAQVIRVAACLPKDRDVSKARSPSCSIPK